MLYEIKNPRQIPGEGKRKWFTSNDLDLIVWYSDNGSLDGFQLCYDKTGDERALTWRKDNSYTHLKVDTGEQRPTSNRTPVLVPNGAFNKHMVLAQFTQESKRLSPELAEIVATKIRDYQ